MNDEIKGISEAGLDLIREFEGLRLTAYLCPAGIPTIGYGHTEGVSLADVRQGRTISREEAEELLRQDLVRAERVVSDLVRVELTQARFDALTSFVFNLGRARLARSTLLARVNRGDFAGAEKEFRRWVYADGKVLSGQVRRRAAEAKIFAGEVKA